MQGDAAYSFQNFHHHLCHLFKMSDELLPSLMAVNLAQLDLPAHLLSCLPGSPVLCAGSALVH